MAQDIGVCDCPVWPVMLWRVPGHGFVIGATIDPAADALADAERYNDLGADEWVAMCPECGLIMDAGYGQPSTYAR